MDPPDGNDDEETENRAANPVKPWRDDEETRIEAMLALKKRTPLQRRIVWVLSSSPGRAFSLEELVGDPAAAPAQVQEAISYLNRIAEALGFVPLIKDTSAGVSVDPETAVVIRHALDELERMGS
ncbi:hypothetical protein [Streptosporangium carneum]|uniref:Uncharacterized protein n=1 Tax=Streptosporangium carneum TaxID=47481 RepID=A0A9W6I181_9ACTN|nr:hypothetical protein [Streptosporangium carneum]GLK09095.1 hypothetical protein GCM10017600_25010 [Streptosporangium carneum]